MCYAVLGVYLVLLTYRHIAHRIGVSRLADGILRSSRQDSARRTRRVRECIRRHTARCFGLHSPVWLAPGGIAARVTVVARSRRGTRQGYGHRPTTTECNCASREQTKQADDCIHKPLPVGMNAAY